MIVIIGEDQWKRFENKLFREIEKLGVLIVATAQENQAKIDALAAVANKVKEEVQNLKLAYDAGQDLDFTEIEAALGQADAINEDAVVVPPVEEPVTDEPV